MKGEIKYLIRDDGKIIVEYSDLILATGRFKPYVYPIAGAIVEPTVEKEEVEAMFDPNYASKDEIVKYGINAFDKVLDRRKSLESLREEIRYLMQAA